MKIGFIGQGWIGQNYADDFERRRYETVRYALEAPYNSNRDKIAGCDVVFIAVPTPTARGVFDYGAVRDALSLVGVNKTAIIKSTILPGTTDTLQKEFPDRFVFHSPEFLTEKNAALDTMAPHRNIIGIPNFGDEQHREEAWAQAREVINCLPRAPYENISTAVEAELVKYGGNNFLFTKVLFANVMYDLATRLGADWEQVKEGIIADPRIGSTHWDPVHQSGHGGVPARGAGGHCFIKDFAAMRGLYSEIVDDQLGLAWLTAIEEKNKDLLLQANKDFDLLKGVYGEDVVKAL